MVANRMLIGLGILWVAEIFRRYNFLALIFPSTPPLIRTRSPPLARVLDAPLVGDLVGQIKEQAMKERVSQGLRTL